MPRVYTQGSSPFWAMSGVRNTSALPSGEHHRGAPEALSLQQAFLLV